MEANMAMSCWLPAFKHQTIIHNIAEGCQLRDIAVLHVVDGALRKALLQPALASKVYAHEFPGMRMPHADPWCSILVLKLSTRNQLLSQKINAQLLHPRANLGGLKGIQAPC